MEQVLVTGGGGFIGSSLVDALLERGHAVRVLDSVVAQVHGGIERPPALNPAAEFHRGDVRDPAAIDRALQGVQVVFHLAAEVGVGQSMYEISRYVGGNTYATAVLLERLVQRKQRVERLVVASSMSIYGEGAYRCPSHGPVYPDLRSDEQLVRHQWEMCCPVCGVDVERLPTAEEKPLRPTSIYAISKMDQELMCLNIGRAYGIPTVALRYFNVYGPRQSLSNPYTGAVAIFASRLLNGNAPLVFEDGRQSRDLVHVSDIVRANLLAMERAEDVAFEVFNVGTGRPTEVAEVAHLLGRELGIEIPPQIVGRFRTGDIRHCVADVNHAHRRLGFTARVPLEVGLRELAAWLREQRATDRVESARDELEAHGLIRG